MYDIDINDYLTQLRNRGFDYDYIDGFEEGYDSDIRGTDLDEYLTELRNNGTAYEYIKGYEDGYNNYFQF